ncbi:acyl carrier protein [Streptomyces sp. ODS28]|uniref:acyl carrier protein n=1 Tax=Streptomyces sp. ODS28 TaxID=3136688 RepID=UPI0031EDB0D7
MESVRDHLAGVLTEKFEVAPERLTPDATLAGLELDSLAVVELFLTLQEHWRVPLDENEEGASELSLREIAALVEARCDGSRTGGPAPGAEGPR